ncbi:MAG: hypothetical protein M3Y13_01780 [Armatimonadota bacterium]|nr:hypothetical protein [Armatimonadota bacterium]
MATETKPIFLHHGARHEAASAPAVRALTSLWLPAAMLFTLTLVVYWLSRTQANTFDAVSYANQIAHLYPRTGDSRWLFHPHHLLFNALGYVLWRAAHALGYRGGSLVVLQSLNATLGAAGISVFYLTLRRLLQRSRWLPFLISLGLAFSFGYWITATDGRVNMPSTFLMVCAFAVLCRTMQSPQPRLAALVGTLSGLAVLFHESTGLFAVVGLAGILLAEDDPLLLPVAMRVRRRAMVLLFLGTWAATVGLPYLFIGIFALHLHSVASFRHWSSEYAELGWWWDFHIFHNIRLDLYAFRHAAFVEPPGKQGTFHLGRNIPFALSRLYFATLIGWLGAVYAFCAALPLLWRSHNRRLMIVCVLWIIVYAAFFTVWSPGYFVFWVPVLVPTAVMLALALAHYRAGRSRLTANWLLGGWIVLYTVLNAQASILPHLGPNADPFRRIASDVRAHTLPGDVVLVAGAGDGGPCEVALPYFADRAVVSLHGLLTKGRNDKPSALATAQTQIDTALASGHAVYALDEVIPGHNAHTQADLLKRHHLLAADLKALLSPYTRTLAWQSPRGPIWRLTPHPPAMPTAQPVAQAS